MRTDADRLRDILLAISKIVERVPDTFDTFKSDELVQVWVIHHLQIVGEACRALSPEFKEKHPHDVWKQAAGLRHILVHHYFDIDAAQLWTVVREDLPGLRDVVQSMT